jgi:hypothetical protein
MAIKNRHTPEKALCVGRELLFLASDPMTGVHWISIFLSD